MTVLMVGVILQQDGSPLGWGYMVCQYYSEI
jgi:hypothetical protein